MKMLFTEFDKSAEGADGWGAGRGRPDFGFVPVV